MRIRVTRWRIVAITAALAASVGATGCGSDNASSTSTATTQKGHFTGTPLTVYVQVPIRTQVANGADSVAAVRAGIAKINAAGGLGGREVKVAVCNDTDANAELTCVRKAIADKALAFLGSAFIFNPKAAQDELRKAGIPSIAPLAAQAVEFGNDINYPIYTTSFGVLACPGQMVDAVGAKKVSLITQELPLQKELAQTVQGVAGATRVPFGKAILVPQTQTDFSSAVQQLDDTGADALVNVLVPPTQTAFFTAMKSVGKAFKGICSVPSVIVPAALRQLGDQVANFYMSSGMPPTDAATAARLPLVKEFRDQLDAEAKRGDDDARLDNLQAEGTALNAYLSTKVLEQVAGDVKGELTAAALKSALDNAQVDLSGAGLPKLDFSKPVPAKGLERLFNPIVNLIKWDPGKADFVSTKSKPVNLLALFGALAKASGK
jgi:ABC-type branched-subunit amino acid transport system substrate-binding protein